MRARFSAAGLGSVFLVVACHYEGSAPANAAAPGVARVPAAAPKTSLIAAPADPALTAPAGPRDIHYRVSRSPGKDEYEDAFVGIVAERAGKTFVVVPPSQGACLRVLVERDIDGDGLTDALLENATACGGNLTPNDYSFVAGTLDDHFEEQPLATQWDTPELVSWQGRLSVVVETNNEGFNFDRPKLTTRRFVFEHGRVVIAEEKNAIEQEALANLRSEQFKGRDEDEKRSLQFDLDGDGKRDRIVGSLWQRWGRFYWWVEFSDGRAGVRSTDACKRLGVLAEKTNGYHDLVCDFDTRFRWNGDAYVETRSK